MEQVVRSPSKVGWANNKVLLAITVRETMETCILRVCKAVPGAAF